MWPPDFQKVYVGFPCPSDVVYPFFVHRDHGKVYLAGVSFFLVLVDEIAEVPPDGQPIETPVHAEIILWCDSMDGEADILEPGPKQLDALVDGQQGAVCRNVSFKPCISAILELVDKPLVTERFPEAEERHRRASKPLKLIYDAHEMAEAEGCQGSRQLFPATNGAFCVAMDRGFQPAFRDY